MTAMLTSEAKVTVRFVDELIDPDVAMIEVVPMAALVARPWLPCVLLMTAIFGFEELHVTAVVMSCDDPSV